MFHTFFVVFYFIPFYAWLSCLARVDCDLNVISNFTFLHPFSFYSYSSFSSSTSSSSSLYNLYYVSYFFTNKFTCFFKPSQHQNMSLLVFKLLFIASNDWNTQSTLIVLILISSALSRVHPASDQWGPSVVFFVLSIMRLLTNRFLLFECAHPSISLFLCIHLKPSFNHIKNWIFVKEKALLPLSLWIYNWKIGENLLYYSFLSTPRVRQAQKGFCRDKMTIFKKLVAPSYGR